ncbi:prolyl aminopeptidase [Halocynthiibacter namhaensis]|uniref:prolyl aminopeptidase n=1 Tax=Halocynthiibacter namhaensis TaxID=1290553 RepID=UPI000578FB90|nr:prolyl aminopeptidase [Halocynthiibacter namhaensis]
MNKTAGHISAESQLYPSSEPFDRRTLDVGDGHQIYVEQCGRRDGIPVIVVHGGPGGGCSPIMRRFFNPEKYRVILFDQRGCGRSRPFASVEHNTTWHLVADMEKIRKTLEIDTWSVFGGSWGATLSLVYAQTHPDRTDKLFLRGVFLARKAELDWFYGGGAGKYWPELWERFVHLVPEGERHDLMGAYHRRLFGDDREAQSEFAMTWAVWENALASMGNNGTPYQVPQNYALAFSRLESHYFVNGAFLDEGQILRDMHKIHHIPATIVQGRYDMICPPTSAWELAKGWNNANLTMIPAAGHALSEPGVMRALVDATNAWTNDARWVYL